MNKWQASILIFLLALVIRFSTINQIGKTWDEPEYVERGYTFIQLFLKGDFENPFWYIQSDHPPLVRYVYGALGTYHLKEYSLKPVYEYNYTIPRLFSSFIGSLSIIFIVLLGYKYFSPRIAIFAGLIFSTIPFYLGLTQLATLESFVMFFYTGSVFFYINYLTENKKKYLILCGIFSGLGMLTKQSNILLFPFLLIVLITYLSYEREKVKEKILKHAKSLIMLGVIAVLTVFILWPMPFLNLKETWAVQDKMWIRDANLPPPEVFFGRLMLVPFPYYVIMFLITTPLTFLVLSLIGLKAIDKKKNFITITILLWFIFPFLQTLYPFKQHGVRYILQLYAPFAMLCALGADYFLRIFKNKRGVVISFYSFMVLYIFLVLYKIKPYYLDYFNEVVGGNVYVYNHQLFQMGWWGQGIGEAVQYIAEKEKNPVKVGITGTQSMIVVPRLKNLTLMDYKSNLRYDYIVVPYFNVVRLGLNESEIMEEYTSVYEVEAGGAPIVRVYKRN